MKIGDLVTLSAAGKGQDQNLVAECAQFGMIIEITDDKNRGRKAGSTYSCTKPLIKVKWFFAKTHSIQNQRTQHHWRYEIKKLKAKPKQ